MPTPPSPQRGHSPAQSAAAAIAVALAFLTVIPVGPLARDASDEDVKASRVAFPVVGVVLGLLLALLSALLHHRAVAAPVAAFVLVAAGAAITGGLHLDGLADTADGLFLWGDPARRLEVMREPHVGSFGVTMVGLSLLGKYAAVASLPGSGRAWGLFAALAVSRSLILVSAGLAPYARPEGAGRLLVEAATRPEAFVAAALALLIASLTAHLAGLIAALAVLGLALGLTRLAQRRLGGVTGDILGAVADLGETGYLVCLCCFR